MKLLAPAFAGSTYQAFLKLRTPLEFEVFGNQRFPTFWRFDNPQTFKFSHGSNLKWVYK